MKKVLTLLALICVAGVAWGQSLTTSSPSTTYGDLLHLSHGNAGVDGTFRLVYDGKGHASGLSISTAGITLANPLGVSSGGTGLSTPGASGNVLTSDGTAWISAAPVGSSMTYPGAGIAVSTGSAWGTSITVPVGVSSGGTGLSTLAAGLIPFGNGTSAFGSDANLSWDNTAKTLTAPLIDNGGQVYNVKAYGAKGDGTTDDTAAIQAAMDAAGAVYGTVYLPPGTYNVTSLTANYPVNILGAGQLATTIRATSATADTLTLSWKDTDVVYSHVSDLGFAASVTRTAGSFAVINSYGTIVERFFMTGYYIGITETDSAGLFTVSDGNFLYGATGAGSAGIYVNGGSGYISRVNMDGPDEAQPESGIHIVSTGGVNITDSYIARHGKDLLVNPGTGQAVYALWALDSFFELATNGIVLAPTGSGMIMYIRFTSCWAATHTGDGIVVDNSTYASGSIIDGVEFIGQHCFNNRGHGFDVLPGVENFRVLGGMISGNAGDGIHFASGASQWSVIGADIGASSGFSGNGGYGVNIVGDSSDYILDSNTMFSNTSGAINNGGSGANARISNNIGLGATIANGPTTTWAKVITGAYTVTSTDSTILCNATSAAFTITLPTAVGITGRCYTIKRINSGSNTVTIATTNSQTIDGATTKALSAQWSAYTVQSDGANWIIIGKV